MRDKKPMIPTRTVPMPSFPLALTFLLVLASAPCAYGQIENEREMLQRRVTLLEQQLTTARGEEHRLLLQELEWLRTRLHEGDFRAGDAIVLQVRGDSILNDTFRVEPPRELILPGLEPIDLTGVLRDELQEHLRRELSRYLRDPYIVAYPLIRVGVLGGVTRPGFYLFRPSTPVVDVFASAGGFHPYSKTEGIELRRTGRTVVAAGQFQRAMAAGWDLRRLDVQTADEIYVPPGSRPMTTREVVLTAVGVASFAVNLLFAFNIL